MRRKVSVLALALSVALLVGLWIALPSPPPQEEGAVAPTASAPEGRTSGGLTEVVEQPAGPRYFYESSPRTTIRLAEIPRATPSGAEDLIIRDERPEMPISREEAARLRAEALNTPFSPNIQILPEAVQVIDDTGGNDGTLSGIGEGVDASNACDGCALVPPDPEAAVGPDHIVAVSNIAFLIIERATGNVQHFFFEDFFAGVSNCTGVFDPNVIYDESRDRFVLGIDADGTHYCVAANSTSGDLSTWNGYSFQTVRNRGEFFDYPHAGVGVEAIFMGANMFRGNSFLEGRIWAMDKADLFTGAATLSVVRESVGADSTPQPANLHGAAEGTFPTSGPHHFLTDDTFDGDTYGVWSWSKPFNGSGGTLSKLGVVDLVAATGVPAAFPIDAPQLNGNDLQANDWRVQDAEFRNGHLHMTTTIACNPGNGTVNCGRWAIVDPAGPSVVDAGVFASDGVHRTFADTAPDACGNLAFGYTKTSASIHPAIWLTGREAGDPAGTVQPEVECRAGDAVYDAFDSPPHRWGDYSGMTVAPDGVTFFYLGEYSKDPAALADPTFTSANWGTFVCEFSFPCSF